MVTDYNYESLAIAIVKRAADDYTEALCKTRGNCLDTKVNTIEKFFTSGRINDFVPGADGSALAKKIRKECKEFDYSLRRINASRNAKSRNTYKEEE